MIRKLQLVVINVFIIVLLLFLVEGFAGYYFVAKQMGSVQPIAERVHTEYDEEIGWINLPNVHIENMYGPGEYLTTNSQRYRGSEDITKRVPEGKVRIICSGDSFTLGYGVDDDHTWCHLLTRHDDRLETVNLGQGGYGVDQAYLWYKRNEASLDHDIQVFAFITGDFLRMMGDSFIGYGKPYLEIRDGVVVQTNRPVPKRAYDVPLLRAMQASLSELWTAELLRRVARRVGSSSDELSVGERNKRTRDVAARIFTELQRLNRAKGSELVFVYLPTLDDYMGTDADTEEWREFVRAEAEKNGYALVDLVDEFRQLSPEEVQALYDGHYSDGGNEFVAAVLYRRLAGLGGFASVTPAEPYPARLD